MKFDYHSYLLISNILSPYDSINNYFIMQSNFLHSYKNKVLQYEYMIGPFFVNHLVNTSANIYVHCKSPWVNVSNIIYKDVFICTSQNLRLIVNKIITCYTVIHKMFLHLYPWKKRLSTNIYICIHMFYLHNHAWI